MLKIMSKQETVNNKRLESLSAQQFDGAYTYKGVYCLSFTAYKKKGGK
jgi:hypothetical protein